MNGPLHGRRVLVSGGSSGLGAAIVRACADAGARTTVLARGSDRLRDVARHPGVIATAVCDVANPDATRETVAKLSAAMGGLDALVNVAGLMLYGSIEEARVDDWHEMFRVNILGTAHVTRAALSYLRSAEAGDVVLISSLAQDVVVHPDYTMYAASKAALPRFAEGLRAELAGRTHVRVTLVKPGMIRTDALQNGHPSQELQKRLEKLIPFALSPEIVASEIVHILSRPRELTVAEVTLLPTGLL